MGAMWSFPLTLLLLVYEKQQVNHDKWPAAILLLKYRDFFLPLILF